MSEPATDPLILAAKRAGRLAAEALFEGTLLGPATPLVVAALHAAIDAAVKVLRPELVIVVAGDTIKVRFERED